MSAPVIEQQPIQFDKEFLNLARKRLEAGKDRANHHFDYCKDKPLREAAVFMVSLLPLFSTLLVVSFVLCFDFKFDRDELHFRITMKRMNPQKCICMRVKRY